MGQTCCSQVPDAGQRTEIIAMSKGETLLKKVFDGMDVDDNGKVDVKELNKALRLSEELQQLFNVKYSHSKGNGKGAPPPPTFFTHLIEKFDTDGDGKISYDEFVSYFLPRLDGHEDSIESWAVQWNTFNSIDADHSGKITLKELNIALRGSPEIQKLFNVSYNQPTKGKGKGSAPPLPVFFEKLIKALDTDGDGQISWPEFVAHFRDMSSK